MAQTAAQLETIDPVWDKMLRQAQSALAQDPLLGAMINSSILHHSSLEQALSYRISLKLASAEMPEQMLREIADHTIQSEGLGACLLYTSPSPRDRTRSRMPSSA